MTNIHRLLNEPYWDEKSLSILSRPGSIYNIQLTTETTFLNAFVDVLSKYGIVPIGLRTRRSSGDYELLDTKSYIDLMSTMLPLMECYLLYFIHKKNVMVSRGGFMMFPLNFKDFSSSLINRQVSLAGLPVRYLSDRNLSILVKFAQSVSK
jgi:hypothetical protein